jgi:hypothetical protein
MKAKEGWILLFLFLTLLVPPLVVIIGEVSGPTSYSTLDKYALNSVPGPIRFHLIGDFGDLKSTTPVNNSEPVKVVSEAMQKQAAMRPIDFIISAGDNSYPHAYANFDQTIYELMYKTFNVDSLSARPWYAVLGNHDCVQNPEYEINANELYPMWNMPSNYYNFTVDIGNSSLVGFTFLDGCILLGGDVQEIAKQYDWLKGVLSEQASDSSVVWKVVTVHMPMWSPGDGHGDNEPLKKSLYPILAQYKVDLVLTGHEHVMAHYISFYENGQPQPYVPLPNVNYTCNTNLLENYGPATDWLQGQGMHEVLQGAGGRELYNVCPNKTTSMANLLYAWAEFGFCELYIDTERIQIDYFSISQDSPVFTVRIYSTTNQN